MGDSNIEAQVAEFFAERGLLPVVPVQRSHGGFRPKVHAAYPESPLTPLCPRSRVRGQVMRSAQGRDLAAPPCRGCTSEHIYHCRQEGFADDPVLR